MRFVFFLILLLVAIVDGNSLPDRPSFAQMLDQTLDKFAERIVDRMKNWATLGGKREWTPDGEVTDEQENPNQINPDGSGHASNVSESTTTADIETPSPMTLTTKPENPPTDATSSTEKSTEGVAPVVTTTTTQATSFSSAAPATVPPVTEATTESTTTQTESSTTASTSATVPSTSPSTTAPTSPPTAAPPTAAPSPSSPSTIAPTSPSPSTTGVNAVTNCGDLEKETTAEVMDSCTASIGSTKNYRLVVDATVDPAKWETFAKNLQTIDGVHLVIENSPLVKLDLPALAKISSSNGDFIISNNQHLTKVSVAVKQEMTLQNFKIENNPKLTKSTLSIPSVKIGKDFVVAGNSAMTDMDTSDIVNFVAGNLLVMNNKELKRFEVEGLETIEISGDITVKKNSHMKTIKIGRAGVLSLAKFPRLIVMQNIELRFIDGVLETQLKIRGNPSIKDFILLKLNNLAKPTNDIQPLGECIFDEKIDDLTELEFCKIVGSDLELANNVEGSATGVNITEISGNVNLGNAKPEQVEFLEKAKTIGGSITSSNCSFPKELYGHSVIIRPASPCPTKATTRTTDKPVDSAVPDKKPSAPPSAPSDPDHSTEGPAAATIYTMSAGFWTAEGHTIVWSSVALVLIFVGIVAFIICCCCMIKKHKRKLSKRRKRSKKLKEDAKNAAKKKNKRTVVVGPAYRPSDDAQEILRVKSNREMAPAPADLHQPDDPPLDPTQFVHKRIVIDAHPPVGPLRHPSPGDGVETSLKDVKFVEDEIELADMGTDVEEYNESHDIVFVAIPKRDENTIFVDDTQDDTPPPRRNRSQHRRLSCRRLVSVECRVGRDLWNKNYLQNFLFQCENLNLFFSSLFVDF